MNSDVNVSRMKSVIDEYKKMAYESKGTDLIRECLALCQGIILYMINSEINETLYNYAEHAQHEMYDIWDARIKEAQDTRCNY